MESKNLLTLIITLVVGVILAGSLLAPVISDAQNATSDKIEHKTSETAPFVENATEYTFVASPSETLINGEASAMPKYTQAIATNKGVLYHISDTTYSLFLPEQNVSTLIHLSDTVSIKATLNGSALSITAGPNTYTETVDTAYVFVGGAAGDIAANTLINSTFTTNPGTSGLITMGDGYYSQKNGAVQIEDWSKGEATLYYYSFASSGSVGTESTEKVTWTVTDNDDGSITISDIESENGTLAEENTHTYRILHDNKYWTYSPTSISTLIGVIPIMVIVTILMVAVGAIAYRRAD